MSQSPCHAVDNQKTTVHPTLAKPWRVSTRGGVAPRRRGAPHFQARRRSNLRLKNMHNGA